LICATREPVPPEDRDHLAVSVVSIASSSNGMQAKRTGLRSSPSSGNSAPVPTSRSRHISLDAVVKFAVLEKCRGDVGDRPRSSQR
jgi:hypothetical protein